MASTASKCDFNRRLYEAAINGDIKCFKEEDEPLDRIVTSIKNTILHIYITNRDSTVKPTDSDFVRDILRRCPSLLTQVNANGDTPLHLAARYGYYDVVEALIEGAKAQHEDLESGLGGDHSKQEMLRMRNNQGNSALHEAVRNDHIHQEIKDLSTPDATGPYEQGIIRRDLNWIFEQLPQLEKSKDPQMVIAALMATVTFTAALTMPGGYKSEEGPDQGTAFLSRKAAFQAFVITDTISMACSLLAVYLEFIASWKSTDFWYYRLSARWLILVSIIAMVVAFSTGTYAVLPPSSRLGIVSCVVGLSFFFFLFAIVERDRKWRKVVLN